MYSNMYVITFSSIFPTLNKHFFPPYLSLFSTIIITIISGPLSLTIQFCTKYSNSEKHWLVQKGIFFANSVFYLFFVDCMKKEQFGSKLLLHIFLNAYIPLTLNIYNYNLLQLIFDRFFHHLLIESMLPFVWFVHWFLRTRCQVPPVTANLYH